jgi:hypothetical protein
VKIRYGLAILAIVFLMSSSLHGVHVAQSQSYSSNNGQNFISTNQGSPIVISRDSFSPTSIVHILIHAPDFNSSPYAIDTIGNDGESIITISTREGSIPYKLVETGFDTGDFAGYVTLSGTTSTCSPVCGPTDGFLAATGDDGITVSFSYKSGGTTFTSTSPGMERSPIQNSPIQNSPIQNSPIQNSPIQNSTVPEFGSVSEMIVTISLIACLIISIKVSNTPKA